MHRTIFDTPVLRSILSVISVITLKISGWEIGRNRPEDKKFVVIAAPHTSNWDMPVMLLFAFAIKLKIYWIGKEEIFKKPFGSIMKYMGGIPIDRSKSNNVVDESVKIFKKNEKLILVVPPEGTRKKTLSWKTGFYFIAHGASVPVYLGYMDWGKKRVGVGPSVFPCGDIKKDMETIKAFYSDMKGKYDTFCSEAKIIIKKKKTEK